MPDCMNRGQQTAKQRRRYSPRDVYTSFHTTLIYKPVTFFTSCFPTRLSRPPLTDPLFLLSYHSRDQSLHLSIYLPKPYFRPFRISAILSPSISTFISPYPQPTPVIPLDLSIPPFSSSGTAFRSPSIPTTPIPPPKLIAFQVALLVMRSSTAFSASCFAVCWPLSYGSGRQVLSLMLTY